MKRFLLLCLMLFAPFCAPAQDAPRDYLAERRALAASTTYKPYLLAIKESAFLEEHFKRANDPKFTLIEANEPLKALIDAYPLGILPNLSVAKFIEYVVNNVEGEHPDQEMLDRAAEYRAVAQGVIDSILSTGDGRSTATAWEVINQNEEYALMEHLGLDPQDQTLIFDAQKPHDMFTVTASDGTQQTVYFDVSLFFGKSAD